MTSTTGRAGRRAIASSDHPPFPHTARRPAPCATHGRRGPVGALLSVAAFLSLLRDRRDGRLPSHMGPRRGAVPIPPPPDRRSRRRKSLAPVPPPQRDAKSSRAFHSYRCGTTISNAERSRHAVRRHHLRRLTAAERRRLARSDRARSRPVDAGRRSPRRARSAGLRPVATASPLGRPLGTPQTGMEALWAGEHDPRLPRAEVELATYSTSAFSPSAERTNRAVRW